MFVSIPVSAPLSGSESNELDEYLARIACGDRQALAELYHSTTIDKFMKASYAYCVTHEKEIRRHINEAEKAEIK